MKVSFELNGELAAVDADAEDLLLDVVRRLGLTGTKEGCGVGICGACTVLVDELPVSSCLFLAPCAEGASVWTVEGLVRRDPALLAAFVEAEALQCGICTPGQLVGAYACATHNAATSEEAIREFMAGNLCRCTGYDSIARAVSAYARAADAALPESTIDGR